MLDGKTGVLQGREGRGFAAAEKGACATAHASEGSGEKSLRAEALTAHGMTLARQGRPQEALRALEEAFEVAREAGDAERAGLAALTIIEELGARLPGGQLCATYERAAELLLDSRNLTTLRRLCAGARRTLFLLGTTPSPPDWEGFSLKEAIQRFEAGLIEKALRDAGGLVTRAAQLLGIKYHNGLVSMLNSRHRNLLPGRTPVLPRRRIVSSSVPREEGRRERPGAAGDATARAVSILYAEDDLLVAAAVRETLESEGWKVETCADGEDALGLVLSAAPFDALLLDNGLPGVRGVEIARRARALPRHRRTPILMLSASECEREARAAGVDAFLRKPQDVTQLAATIRRLLAGGEVSG
ncbi:MAG TPA: response regulator [Pyrinomonadaceae bacterium]|nr:response regulator [Pyrinomonadaceae bacterium]